jgi:AmmeMemoRadiSam system protein B/AmmeMemoRadiSam system protein A
MNSTVKMPAVAGSFYPADSHELRSMIASFLAEATLTETPHPRIIIAPHAGYIFSGAIAANAYRVLSTMQHIKRVVLLGPAHYVAIDGVALPSYTAFRTPLGDIPVDHSVYPTLLTIPHVNVVDEPFEREHSLEVQLPFLQTLLPHCNIVPILVGHPDKTLIVNLINQFWSDPDTLIVVSSDLSHYHKYDVAKQIDQQTLSAILKLEPDLIEPERACGCFAIKGALEFAKQKRLQPSLKDLRNSGDTQGPRDRVVGYSAIHFYEAGTLKEELTREDELLLLAIAKASIEFGLKYHKEGHFSMENIPEALKQLRATFVTLTVRGGTLRGCIGSIEAYLPLMDDVAKNAYASAFNDSRFKPLQPEELSQLAIEISVLSPMEAMSFSSEADLLAQLRPHVDGVLIQDQQHRGVFLPLVWEQIPDKAQFWQALKQKANLPPGHWSDTMKAWRFTARKIE